MKYNKLASVFCSAALGLLLLTGCEGGDLYSVGAPDWISAKADSIANEKNKNKSDDDNIEGLMEDVYTIGNTDFSSGWWAAFSKYYQVPDGEKWQAQFNLFINPSAAYTYKNFAMVFSTDYDRGDANYKEYFVIRYDHQPSGNSEWGDYINRDLVESTLTFGTDTDKGIEKLAGKVTITVDRTDPAGIYVRMSNGTVVKTYKADSALPNLNADTSNGNIRCFFVPEGSYINFIGTTIVPIGGLTSAEDKEPVSMELSGIPSEVLLGTPLEEAMANVQGVVNFQEGVSKEVTAEDLQFQAIPNYDEVGTKTLVVIYNKTFKGANCSKPIIFSKTFSVVKELSAFTQTYVVPTPTILGAEDNTSGWWSAHTDNIKVEPKETKVVNFTNYTSGVSNWNNFVIVLNKASLAEYAVVRADNYGWGDGYAACTPSGGQADWDKWLAAMNGAKVTAYITNNGDGTADIKTVMYGTDGVTYYQDYIGINTVDPDDMYFRFTIDGCHLVFDKQLGASDNSSGWWSAHTTNVKVAPNQVCTINFTNYTSGASNWNNFVVVLNKANLAEYAVVRADNYGWGDGYAACTPSGGQEDWGKWLAAMNGAKVTVTIANNGNGTADVKAVMHGTDGVTYTQDYIGINTIDADDFYFRFTVDGCHMVFE